MEDLNPEVRFTVPAIVADALDSFYSARRRQAARPIRRAMGQGQLPEGSPQVLVTTQFVYGVIEQRAKSGEDIEQTIFRLLGEVRNGGTAHGTLPA